jgi:hypothetical protein
MHKNKLKTVDNNIILNKEFNDYFYVKAVFYEFVLAVAVADQEITCIQVFYSLFAI